MTENVDKKNEKPRFLQVQDSSKENQKISPKKLFKQKWKNCSASSRNLTKCYYLFIKRKKKRIFQHSTRKFSIFYYKKKIRLTLISKTIINPFFGCKEIVGGNQLEVFGTTSKKIEKNQFHKEEKFF